MYLAPAVVEAEAKPRNDDRERKKEKAQEGDGECRRRGGKEKAIGQWAILGWLTLSLSRVSFSMQRMQSVVIIHRRGEGVVCWSSGGQ